MRAYLEVVTVSLQASELTKSIVTLGPEVKWD